MLKPEPVRIKTPSHKTNLLLRLSLMNECHVIAEILQSRAQLGTYMAHIPIPANTASLHFSVGAAFPLLGLLTPLLPLRHPLVALLAVNILVMALEVALTSADSTASYVSGGYLRLPMTLGVFALRGTLSFTMEKT